jgi:alkanesulfonate monooxygenase SsuD/methylene tetrahydromethanopterin reductase-like flavin-dependent oxidoreductase (luciferase family)
VGLTIGMAIDFATPTRRLDQHLDRCLELIRLGEAHGFDSVWAGESYPASPDGYTVRSNHLPSPLLILAALAGRTQLTLGTGVTLLPGWQPLKLAYDAAVLDQLAGGRFILGIGLGSPRLWQRFGLDRPGLPEYFEDTLTLLKALWSGQEGFRGRSLTVEGGIAPLPVQPGGPPLWVGGSVRRSAERAARLGDAWYASTTYTFERIARQSQHYRAALAQSGKDASRPIVAANRLTVVADTEAQAHELAVRHIGAVLHGYRQVGAFRDHTWSGSETPSELFALLDQPLCLVGTPDQVLARLHRYAEAGVTHLQLRLSPADLPLEAAARTIELVGTRLIPRLGS